MFRLELYTPEELSQIVTRSAGILGIPCEAEGAMELARRLEGKAPVNFPRETAMGAMALYISDQSVVNFQPMNVNFGIISPLGCRVKGKRNKNAEISKRSLEIIESLKAKEVFHCEDNH